MIEKKYIAIVGLAFVLAMIPACARNAPVETADEQSTSFPMSVFSDDLSINAPTESVPKTQSPTDEKTFLVCPDGAPIFTSEITEIYSGNEETNDKKSLTLFQAENAARNKRDFKVKCDGFAYGYFPEPSFDRNSLPEAFGGSSGIAEYDRSSEFIRVKTGDTFGTLTVKNACSYFNTNWNLTALSNTAGAYYSGSLIEYDGEIELSGYASVETGKSSGSLTFYPEGDSITKLPCAFFNWDNDKKELFHSRSLLENWCGDYWINDLANIHTTSGVDFGDLKEGDELVKVKVTLSDIVFEREISGAQKVTATLKDLKVSHSVPRET